MTDQRNHSKLSSSSSPTNTTYIRNSEKQVTPYTACFPRIYYYGNEGDYNVLVMELLGPNLENLYTMCGSKLSLKSTILISDQIVNTIT
jgi:hypothetical protein